MGGSSRECSDEVRLKVHAALGGEGFLYIQGDDRGPGTSQFTFARGEEVRRERNRESSRVT